MPKYICLSCLGSYDTIQRGAGWHPHVCPSERIKTHAVCDPTTGAIKTPAVLEPMPNPRNENPRPDLQYIEGKPKLVSRDPTDSTRRNVVDADTFIVSEGLGRALYVEGQITGYTALPQPTIPGT